MKYLLLLILIPQFALASALVIKDDFNKIFNVIAIFDFPVEGVSDADASFLTESVDLYLNNLTPEVQVGAETWTVLFNIDYQLGETKYPLSNSCAHNRLNPKINFNVNTFVSSLGEHVASVSVVDIKRLPFATLNFVNNLTCLGAGAPVDI